MAYTIISQNNTTTTLQDENGNIIYVPGRVTLATSTDYTITEVNNNTATLTDGSGKVIRDVPCVVVLAGGGGGSSDTHNKGYYATPEALAEAEPTAEAGDWAIVGSTDTVWVWDEDSSAWVDTDTKGEVTPDMIIVKSATMPTASTTPGGAVYQYIGATDSTYTHGYIYENKVTTSYDSTVSFEAATLSSSTIACSGSDFATFVAEWGSGDITTITHGTLTYDQSGGLLVFVGKDSEETTVCTFQLYTQDYEDAGFTITGTLQDGDVFAFTTTITEINTYAWERIDVQPTPVIPDPLPSQTGQSGKFLTTDGTDASWSDKPLVNTATGTDSVNIIGSSMSGRDNVGVGKNSNIANGEYCVALGSGAAAQGAIGGTAIGAGTSSGGHSVALGRGAKAGIRAAQINISLNSHTNNDTNTFKVANNNGNFEMMSADGTIPTDRYTTTPSADGTYVPTLTISSGVATRSWGAAASAPVVPATMPTLAVADWSSNTQTVNVTGVTASNIVFVSPAPASAADYAAAGIVCTAQGSGTLTFTCTTVPSNAITVNVVILG